MSSRKSSDIVLLSTADWDATVWTNKQHTARSLARQGATVLYVESMGLRSPTVRTADIRRVLRRAVRSLRPPVLREPGIYVWSPPSIPLQRYATIRRINRSVATIFVGLYSRILLRSPLIYWTYNPMTLALIKVPQTAKLLYHCVDDVSEQPGMPSLVIRSAEKELVKKADLVSVTSRALEDRWSAERAVMYEPNVVDRAIFKHAVAPDPMPALVRLRDGPIIGFVGALAAYKMDLELVRELAETHPNWTVVLVGPTDPSENANQLAAIDDLANVVRLPPVPYDQVPSVMRMFDVGIIPAVKNDYTRAMFPMKFFEYLAAGVPVVATDLDALRDFTDIAAVVRREEFVDAIEDALRGPGPDLLETERVLTKHSYDARTRRMLDDLDKITVPRDGGDR